MFVDADVSVETLLIIMLFREGKKQRQSIFNLHTTLF